KSPEQECIKEKPYVTVCCIKKKWSSVRRCTSSVPIFANGALSGAFGYLFNQCGDGKCIKFSKEERVLMGKSANHYLRELKVLYERSEKEFADKFEISVDDALLVRSAITEELRPIVMNGIVIDSLSQAKSYIYTLPINVVTKGLSMGKYGKMGEIAIEIKGVKDNYSTGKTIKGWYSGDSTTGYGVICNGSANCGMITPKGYYSVRDLR
ncbi:hypothetical protein, partial [Thiolapillus sp.]|uniref:hypothetical protein n=1 Tax=Thiolapillus sp. TaxID=2017437 RepID=UPI003AF5A2EA